MVESSPVLGSELAMGWSGRIMAGTTCPPCGLTLHRPARVVHRAVLGGEQSSQTLKAV